MKRRGFAALPIPRGKAASLPMKYPMTTPPLGPDPARVADGTVQLQLPTP